MGEIYSNAYCTVIAAAGEDAQTGLAGVAKTPRRKHHEVSIKGVTLAEMCYSSGHGSALLSSSKWATRAWTYQECHLSTRRIVFTEHQVMYLCNREYIAEPFRQPITITGKGGQRTFGPFVPHTSYAGRYFHVKELRQQIEEYTTRNMTLEGDSLNAFLGVLGNYVRTNRPILHLWGLALREDEKTAQRPKDMMLDLFWWHELTATRRRDFPSWSWVGWAGPASLAKLSPHPDMRLRSQQPSDPKCSDISVEDGGVIKTLYEYALPFIDTNEDLKFRPPLLRPRELRLSCHVLPVRWHSFQPTGSESNRKYMMHVEDPPKSGHWETWGREPRHEGVGPLVVVRLCEGINLCIEPYLDTEVDRSIDLHALYLGTELEDGRPYLSRGRQLLLVRSVGGDSYERVGLIRWLFTQGHLAIFGTNDQDQILNVVNLPHEDELFYSVAERKTVILV